MLLSTVQFLVRLSRETQDQIWFALCDEWSELMDQYTNGLVSFDEYLTHSEKINDALDVIAAIQLA